MSGLSKRLAVRNGEVTERLGGDEVRTEVPNWWVLILAGVFALGCVFGILAATTLLGG